MNYPSSFKPRPVGRSGKDQLTQGEMAFLGTALRAMPVPIVGARRSQPIK
jgi:hypothetical protein